MSTDQQIYWAIQRHRQPAMVAAALRLKQLKIKLDQDRQSLIQSTRIDAAEVLGIDPVNLSHESSHHLELMSDVITSYFNDVIDSSGLADQNKSTSSYLQG